MEQPNLGSRIRHSTWFTRRKASLPRPVRQAHAGVDTAVGERTFGKAYVNCALRGNNSKWGKLRDKDAAVLQLLIDPRQQDGFKLRELVLELSFAEADPSLVPAPTTIATATAPTTTTVAATVSATPNAEPSLVILEPPSPKNLKGKTTIQHSAHELLVQPQVGAGGISIGGMGLKTTKDKDVERSWRFKSHWANNELGLYTTAQWMWKAVAENPDIEDVGGCSPE
ncbi:hypothetical protein A1O3_01132 [Capronia epimyces CBS 606.96]|uniref:Uncharacterized protein n=1 Tax=Capronia epimyces CBS 606.96 TaxID=1182542 RepID=W9YSE3_9EURO|nr:uncharacterized protein A1O3_01132 [Capronia epimyces CBS 606.96]EXJ92580.1 hypothetical protein A1O3_01132 [Capronia epimyces CBS 606.96]